MKTLQEVKDEHIIYAYRFLKFNKTRTAKAIGISVRSLQSNIKRIEAKGVDFSKITLEVSNSDTEEGLECYETEERIFPTNEERIAHMDYLTRGWRKTYD